MRPTRSNRVLFLAAVLAVCAAFAPCAFCSADTPHTDAPPLRLRVGTFLPSTSGTNVQSQINAEIVRVFQDRHPNIEIAPATGVTVPGLTMDIAPLMQIAGDIPPDLLYVNMRKSESYISQGMLWQSVMVGSPHLSQ